MISVLINPDKKLSCCWDNSRYKKIGESSKSANPQ